MGKHRATETHCAHGHEWTPENTRYYGKKRPQRFCATCHAESKAKSARAPHRDKADPLQVAFFRAAEVDGTLDKLLMRMAGFQLKPVDETAA